MQRAAQALASPIHRILGIEAASGVILLVVSAVALTWANVATASYVDLWHTPIGLRVGGWAFERPLEFWINDGLMTVFFFVVGLEIRREIYEGELASLRKAALPLAAALGGMLAPAVIFAALNAGRLGAAGWAIPMATDIAFAVGVLTLLGRRVPTSLRIFLLALAVIDDIGAIIVIALFYSTGVRLDSLLLAAGALAVVWMMRTAGVRSVALYLVPGAVAWAGMYGGGIHPTIAGVVLGLMTPVRPWFGAAGFAESTKEHLEELAGIDRHELHERLRSIERARREAVSPTERLIHALHPWVAFGIMPVFALANAGVVLGGAELTGDYRWLFFGVVGGLALGKPIGIACATLASDRVGIGARMEGMTPRGIMLVGLVGGIGFTMSLFIAQLAFPPGPLLATAKLAIMVGSGISMLTGLLFALVALRKRSAPDAAAGLPDPPA